MKFKGTKTLSLPKLYRIKATAAANIPLIIKLLPMIVSNGLNSLAPVAKDALVK
jgi:hypothetical protein